MQHTFRHDITEVSSWEQNPVKYRQIASNSTQEEGQTELHNSTSEEYRLLGYYVVWLL
jgi:hypothetical protein